MIEYEEMLYMEHHVSKKHPQMSLHDRAAQFSPFAALTGYEDVIGEAARLTEKKHILDENRWEELQRRFASILELELEERMHLIIEVTHFRKDEKKEGGSYVKSRGYLKKADFTEKKLLLSEGSWILFEDVYDVNFCKESSAL